MPSENESSFTTVTDSATKEVIAGFAAQAMRIADRRTILMLGKVANASHILEKTGLNVAGFMRVLDNYGVRHTIKQHGNPTQEARRGQIDRHDGRF
jgi:hypothetical protein